MVGANNLLLSDGTFDYEYDAEGNRTKKTDIATGDYVEYEWDHRNRLVRVTYKDAQDQTTKAVVYDYDLFDRRISKQVDETGDGTIDRAWSYVYDQGQKSDPAHGVGLDDVVLVFDDTGSLTNRYLHGPAIDQVFADENALGEILWALSDNQHTVRDIAKYDAASDTTAVVNHRTFDAFGNITSQSDPSVEFLYAYTGREWDADAELYYYRARWYDPVIGRFISHDPIGFAAGDANLSRYVSNSPANFVDPSGLKNQGVGHHFLPVAVLEKFIGYLSKAAENLALGYTTGQTTPDHCFKHYGGISHDAYNKMVEDELKDWLKDNGYSTRKKVPADKLKEFTDRLHTPSSKKDLASASNRMKDIWKFNAAVMDERAEFMKQHPRAKSFPIGKDAGVDQLVRQGKQYKQKLEAIKNYKLQQAARSGRIDTKALLGLGLAQGFVTSVALYPYEFCYLEQGGSKVGLRGEALFLDNLLRKSHLTGSFPDGTRFPSDRELKEGVQTTIILEGSLRDALKDTGVKAPDLKTFKVYHDLIIHLKEVEDGKYYFQVQQVMPEGYDPRVRMPIAPGTGGRVYDVQ